MFQQDITLGPGTGTLTSHTLEILVMLSVAFILGIWLGWTLWSRYRQEAEQLRLDLSSANASLTALRGELEALKVKYQSSFDEVGFLKTQNDQLQHDLSIHREQLAQTESQLAQAHHRIRQLETELGLGAGSSFAPTTHLEPESFPEAAVAFEGIETEANGTNSPASASEPAAPEESNQPDTSSASEPLEPTTIRIVDVHTDQAVTVQLNNPSPQVEIRLEAAGMAPAIGPSLNDDLENLDQTARLDDVPQPEIQPLHIDAADLFDTPGFINIDELEEHDLTHIPGISAHVAALLKKHGIHSYAQLAETPVPQLRVILEEGGFERIDATSWPKHAAIIANKR